MNKKELQSMPTRHDGDAYITIGGDIDQAMIIAKCDVKTEGIATAKRFLNNRVEQNATRGIKISGSLSYYAVTSKLARAMEDFKNGGRYPDLTVQTFATLESGGRFEVLLTGVHLNTVALIGLDDSDDAEMVHETDFTANDFQIIQALEG